MFPWYFYVVGILGPLNPCQLTYAFQVVSIWSCIYISYSVKSCHKRSPPSWQKRQKLIKMSVVSTVLGVSNKRWISTEGSYNNCLIRQIFWLEIKLLWNATAGKRPKSQNWIPGKESDRFFRSTISDWVQKKERAFLRELHVHSINGFIAFWLKWL